MPASTQIWPYYGLSVCLFVSEAMYLPTYPYMSDVVWMSFANRFFTLATVIDLPQGQKKVKYNCSKCIVYEHWKENMMEINVWINNA